MEQFIIEGPTVLKGKVDISGSKNAALPIIASTILFSEDVELTNIPEVKDIRTLLGLLKNIGIESQFKNNKLTIHSKNSIKGKIDPDLVKHLRASILLVAPILVKTGEIEFPHPGGCLIGSRPIDVLLEGLKKMGAKIEQKSDSYRIFTDKLKSTALFADFSVTGTENIILASVLAKGETRINMAASEPHVQDLCNFLNLAGANIQGVGTHNLIIKGVEKLKGIKYEIIPDQIEAGTFAIAAAASGGEVEINGFVSEHQEALFSKFNRAKVNYEVINDKTIKVKPNKNLGSFSLRTEIYPGFPTDLQAPMAVLATQCSGSTEIHETIFEGRLGYITELSKMGADCDLRDSHQVVITGPTSLTGQRITSFDLRAGATLIIAAIVASGESRIDQIEIIDRGYEKIEEKFAKLGAKIKRVKLKEV